MWGQRTLLHRARGRLVGASAALAVCLAGCGSAGSPDFASQANTICKATVVNEKKIAAPSSTSGLATYISQELPVARQGLAKLEALKPPASEKPVYGQYMSDLTQEVSLLVQAGAAAQSRHISKAASLANQAQTLDTQSNAKAKSLGLTGCA